MSIVGDLYEEKYGDLIKAADDYSQSKVNEIKAEKQKIIDSLNFKLTNLQEMFLNVCKNVYMLKSGDITIDQLVAIVNGCLDPRLITEFNWLYLKSEEEKKQELTEMYKKVDEYNKSYLNDLMAELKSDDVDTDDEIELIEGENGQYKVNFNPEVTNATMKTFNNHDNLESLENLKIVASDIEKVYNDTKPKTRKKRQTKAEIIKEAKEQFYKELEEDKKWNQYASDPRNK